MKANDPTCPDQWNELVTSISNHEAMLQDAITIQKSQRKRLNGIEYKLKQLEACSDPSSQIASIARTVDDRVDNGIPLSNRELRELLTPDSCSWPKNGETLGSLHQSYCSRCTSAVRKYCLLLGSVLSQSRSWGKRSTDEAMVRKPKSRPHSGSTCYAPERQPKQHQMGPAFKHSGDSGTEAKDVQRKAGLKLDHAGLITTAAGGPTSSPVRKFLTEGFLTAFLVSLLCPILTQFAGQTVPVMPKNVPGEKEKMFHIMSKTVPPLLS